MKTLQDLFLEQLADLYDAESRLTRALPKMAKAATHDELREAFENHLNETEEHVKRVEEVFGAINKKPHAKKCAAMVGLIEEADEIASENKGAPTINAALIAAAQKVEHYEIASYGSLREWARVLENEEAADILEEILDQEKAADETLTDLAESVCNEAAKTGESESESEEEEQESPKARKGGKTAARG